MQLLLPDGQECGNPSDIWTDCAALLQTFWHSSAHVLGEALEALFGVRLTIGPHVEEGFYYDCYMGDRTLTDAEKPLIERKIEQASFPLCASACTHSSAAGGDCVGV